ncbi:hypothetical protein PM082_006296 [Marasmius tenuissimus]|nr:hypothetical protein PM082_006296 [Marasmius tenuissimus]
MEVNQGHSNNVNGFVTASDDFNCLSNTMDQKRVDDPIVMASSQVQSDSRGAEPIINSDRVTNKRQRRGTGFEGTERSNPKPDLRHKNNTTNDQDLAMEGQNSRLVQPLSTRFLPFTDPVNPLPPIPLKDPHLHQGHQLQPHPFCFYRNQPSYHYSSHPANPSLGDVSFAPYGVNMPFSNTPNLSSLHLQLRGWPELSPDTAPANRFNAVPSFNAYNSAEIANSASDLTANTMHLDYTAISAYSDVNAIENAPRYDGGADRNTGWSGTSQVETPAAVNMLYSGPTYSSTPYSMPVVTHPSDSAVPVDFTYSPHSATPPSHVHDPGHPFSFPSYGEGSFAPQEYWNPPVTHHDPSHDSLSSFPPGITHYPSNSTVDTRTSLPLSAHTLQSHPSMLPWNGGDPVVPHQPWSTPANYPQQYTYDLPMQSTQWNTENETSGEYGEGNGASGW